MYGKSALLLIVLFASFVGTTMYYFYGSSIPGFELLRPHRAAVSGVMVSVPPCRSYSPLKVYMYDLPRRFNIGMLHPQGQGADNNDPVTASTLPPWPRRPAGLNLQHSVEYWMMASLLYEGGGGGSAGMEEEEGREAVRVSDPEDADVFFVPFFSSMSFNHYGHPMRGPKAEIDRQLQVEVVNILRESKYWKRSGGRDHIIPMQHPNAFRFLRREVNSSIFIVVDFGRYPLKVSNLRKDVVTPYVHFVDTYVTEVVVAASAYDSRPTLLFFRGGTVRKDGGIVRAKLGKILSGYDDVRYENSVISVEGIKLSTEGMRSSKFCLHPAGDTPSSCRLFDAIVSHCVPVIVSDRIELPYEDELDYSEFSIFFSVEESLRPGNVVNQLRQVPRERWVRMWKRLKQVSIHFEFQYPPKKGDGVDMLWRQIRHKLPATDRDVHRGRRLKVPDWWGW